jgi:hypothetical protein
VPNTPGSSQRVGGGGDEIAAVGDESRVVGRHCVDRAQQRDRIDEFAGRFRPRGNLALARFVARAQRREPVGASLGEALNARGEANEKIAGVADRRDVRAAVEPRLARAAVGGDQIGRAAHMAAVVEAEVARRAG